MKKNITVRLTESAVMLAFATVLSVVALVKLPYGGSITACSMLPVLVIAYRHGTAWGLFTGFVYGLLQLLLGLNNLSYATSALAAAAIIVLDYLAAFAVLGLAGLFKKMPNQSRGLTLAAVATCAARYVLHVISGCTVWAGLSIPTADAFIYSLAYNATYMLPETLITAVGAYYLAQMLDFRTANIAVRPKTAEKSTGETVCAVIGKTALAFAAVWDIAAIASKLQNPESGEWMLEGIHQVDWTVLLIVSAVCVAVFAVTFVLKRHLAKRAA